MDPTVSTGILSADSPWFAIRVRSNFEHSVAGSVRNRGYEEYLPLYRIQRGRSGRMRDAELPLFPGYVFSRFDLNRRHHILTVPGVVHIVGAGRTPLPVDYTELAAIRAILASRLPALPWPFLQVGDRIIIDRGPLRGVEGILVAIKGGARLIASITILQRSVAVEIDHAWARRLQDGPRHSPGIPGFMHGLA